jgi:dipeptidyl aminopeptidase/acylaminoacyl peptidase
MLISSTRTAFAFAVMVGALGLVALPAALKARGIDVPYMVKENEGHGFRNEENQFDFYEAMERFLAKYLGRG